MLSARPSPVVRVALAILTLLGLAVGSVADADPGGRTRSDRWYESYLRGQKLGHSRVVWAPSTWRGRRTVHDTTTMRQRSVRNMMGLRDVFETVNTIDLERGEDGTLWWMKSVVEEAGRVSIEEITWTGEGYRCVSKLEGRERTIDISLDEPVMIDCEAFLGARIRAGELEVGDTFELRVLDVRARKARTSRLDVLAREDVEDSSRTESEDAPVPKVSCFKVRETDPVTGAEMLIWLDDDGAYVRYTTDTGSSAQRVDRARAEKLPVRAAESRITTPSQPVLERVFTADRLEVDLHLQGDPTRALPAFPDSPWSRVRAVEGSDDEGWIVRLAVSAYDDPDAKASLPIDRKDFERELESSVLMPCRHELMQETVREVVGEEKDARKAAEKIARYVFETLEKSSPDVAEASAVEILESESGDCSEHALLFVTLCRAAGIPARRCSGYVCVGSDWGAHAWAEIWVGRWIGADPTTGEVGPGARYLFFGYHDMPESYPGLVSARAAGRMRFVVTRVQEGDDDFDLRDPEAYHLHDREAGRYIHALAGLEARDVPRDWVVRMVGTRECYVRGPGLRVEMQATADQGYDLARWGGPNGTFAGAPAKVIRLPNGGRIFLVHSRRRIIQMQVMGEEVEDRLEELERVLAPTFAAPPRAPAEAEPPESPAGEEADDEAAKGGEKETAPPPREG